MKFQVQPSPPGPAAVYETVIARGTVCFPEGMREADLGISDGRIAAAAAPGRLRGKREIVAAGKLIFPGAVDPHVHLEQITASGQTSSDDFRSGSEAALYGGITALGDFAYPEPGERLVRAWARRTEAARERCRGRFFLHQAFGENAPDLDAQVEEVIRAGARSFKLHLNDPRVDGEYLNRVCRLLARPGLILLVHAERGREIQTRVRELKAAGRTGLDSLPLSQPDSLEAGAIADAASAAAEHGTRLYVVHLSSAAGLEAVRRAREAGAEVFAETCPQYLLLTADKYRGPDGYLSTCTPPLRSDQDRDSLWEGLRAGEIQTAATDHCPFTRVQKDAWGGDFTRLPYGIPGVELLVELVFSEGRRRGFSWETLARIVSGAAGEIYGLPARGGIREGVPADLFLYDPSARRLLDAAEMHMNSDFSPYGGIEVAGEVVGTLLGGKVWPGDFSA